MSLPADCVLARVEIIGDVGDVLFPRWVYSADSSPFVMRMSYCPLLAHSALTIDVGSFRALWGFYLFASAGVKPLYFPHLRRRGGAT